MADPTYLAQCESEMNAQALFRPYWISFGLPGIREISSTYDGSDPVGPVKFDTIDSSFSWLAPLNEEWARSGLATSNYLSSREELPERLEQLRRDSPRGVPAEFWSLLSDSGLQDRIPSCTACYIDFPGQWLRSPFRSGDTLVRFMNDQQCCFCWYLYVPRDEAPFVIASSGVFDKDGEYGEPFLEEVCYEGHPERLGLARASTLFVAPDFLSFVYRFWIENVIWYKQNDDVELSDTELSYVRRIAPTFDPSQSDSPNGANAGRPWWRFW